MMESTLDIRKRIHNFVDKADDRILNIINAIINADENSDWELADEHKIILDNRLKEHQKNPNSGKHWNDLRKELKVKYDL